MNRKILLVGNDHAFRGSSPVTRYEMAAALYRMVKYLEELRNDTPPREQHARAHKDPPDGPAHWLVMHSYLPPDTDILRLPASALVSPAVLSDSLAYVADRVILHRGSPSEWPSSPDEQSPPLLQNPD